jgi:hypothetical protein
MRNVYASLGVFTVNLALHSVVEAWAWARDEEALVDRSRCPTDCRLKTRALRRCNEEAVEYANEEAVSFMAWRWLGDNATRSLFCESRPRAHTPRPLPPEDDQAVASRGLFTSPCLRSRLLHPARRDGPTVGRGADVARER